MTTDDTLMMVVSFIVAYVFAYGIGYTFGWLYENHKAKYSVTKGQENSH